MECVTFLDVAVRAILRSCMRVPTIVGNLKWKEQLNLHDVCVCVFLCAHVRVIFFFLSTEKLTDDCKVRR